MVSSLKKVKSKALCMLWNFYSKLLLEFWQLSVLYRCKKNRLLIVLINICSTGVVKKPLAASNMHILNIIIWHEYLHYCFMGIFPDPDPNHFQESGVEGFRENRNPFFLKKYFFSLHLLISFILTMLSENVSVE